MPAWVAVCFFPANRGYLHLALVVCTFLQDQVSGDADADAAVAVAAAFTPALADFDALLRLRREALPAADRALLPPRAAEAAALQCGFVAAGDAGAAEAAAPGSLAQAVLRAVPAGGPCCKRVDKAFNVSCGYGLG